MAKKKSDTKGLAGIVKNVPRELDIKGQKHMLAWITPKEGGTLKALGGAGILGPMGIPAYFDVGEGAGGYGSGDADDATGGAGDPDAGIGSAPSSDGGGSGGGGSYDADTGIDAETDDPDTAGAGSREVGYRGPDEPGGEQMGTPGAGLADYYGGTGGKNLTKEQFAAQILANNVLKGGATGKTNTTWFTDIGSAGTTKARGAVKGIIDAEIARRKGFAEDNYGIPGIVGAAMGALGMANLENIAEQLEDPNSIPAFDDQGRIQGVYSPGPFGLGMVYSGNPIAGYEETGWQDPNKGGEGAEQPKKFGITSTVSATDAITGVSVSPDDYYGKGVGSATINLYDPTQIDAYLAQLYGQTPSPIGATYDAATRSYTMPGSSKKKRTRLRGLDIFKPVSS
jgi:hypothetical protein